MIELFTLGSLELTSAESNAVGSVLAQPRRAALLCYLALALPRGFQRRDTLSAEIARRGLSPERPTVLIDRPWDLSALFRHPRRFRRLSRTPSSPQHASQGTSLPSTLSSPAV